MDELSTLRAMWQAWTDGWRAADYGVPPHGEADYESEAVLRAFKAGWNARMQQIALASSLTKPLDATRCAISDDFRFETSSGS